MSNLMKLLGLVLVVAGVAIGALTYYSPGKMDVLGIKFDSAAIFFVGGVLALGLAGVMDRLGMSQRATRSSSVSVVSEVEPAPLPVSTSIPNFGRKAAEATAATAAVAAASAAMAESAQNKVAESAAKPAQTSVAETISALEQAKADVIKSMGGMDAMTSAAPEPFHSEPAKPAVAAADAAPAEADAEEEAELFVVEEKVIRGRPARILSDETVEAETDEGWMRFENLEHLNEYLDSVEEQGA